ncbi:MAG: methyltransferase domain-containing protein, partial [Propionibacteriaceae bacterium]|nr:methyltransferase domain-containing protein [Propionibacteriaceae bacterium]
LDQAAEVVATAAASPDNPDNVTFETADLFALPYPDASFDVVHLHQVLHHVADPVAALKAVARVAKPGGLIADREGDFGAAWWYPACPGWQVWQTTFLAVGAAEGEDLTIARQLLRVAREAGFTDVTLSASVWSYPGFQPRDEATATWAERLVAPHFVELAEAAGAANRATLEEAVADIKTWAENPDAAFFHPHGEILIRVP